MMRTLFAALACVAAVAAALAPTAFAVAEFTAFRYHRTATGGSQDANPTPVVIVADKPLLAHAQDGLADLRVVDADGREVPWRLVPEVAAESRSVALLNRGRRNGAAVALLDLGPRRGTLDRVTLDVPDTSFVGRVVVLGADTRVGPRTRLGTTAIYDVRGAQAARSTTAVFAPTDFRYLELRATGVSRIDGAAVSTAAAPPAVAPLTARTARRERHRETIVTVDLGYPRVPVDELRITAGTPRYSRPVIVEASPDRRVFRAVASAVISRFPGSTSPAVPVGTRDRYLRVRIDNGDDAPLASVRVEPLARQVRIALEPGHSSPYRLLYGARTLGPPEYEFVRLPFDARARMTVARLGREHVNAAFEPPPDTRSFVERHDWLVEAALGVAAAAVGAVGFLALRRKA